MSRFTIGVRIENRVVGIRVKGLLFSQVVQPNNAP